MAGEIEFWQEGEKEASGRRERSHAMGIEVGNLRKPKLEAELNSEEEENLKGGIVK